MKIEKLSLKIIRPYWRNPRDHTNSLEAIKDSIKRNGYIVPIVVDEEYVILAGHGRYKALMNMGEEFAECIVVSHLSEKMKHSYRIEDNRSGEYSTWNSELLMKIVEDMEIESLKDYFVNMLQNDIIDTKEAINDKNQTNFVQNETTKYLVVCPYCEQETEVFV